MMMTEDERNLISPRANIDHNNHSQLLNIHDESIIHPQNGGDPYEPVEV